MGYTLENSRHVNFFRLCCVVVLGLWCGGCTSPQHQDEALLRQLDKMIENREVYRKKIACQIQSLNSRIECEAYDSVRFMLMGDLFQLYRSYRVDTAYLLACRRLELARRIGEEGMVSLAQMNLADAMNKAGRHDAALHLLKRIPLPQRMAQGSYYYYLLHTTSLSLYEREAEPEARAELRRNIKMYKDTLVRVCEHGSGGWITNKCGLLGMNGHLDEAIALLEEYYGSQPEEHPDRARMEYLLADLYLERGEGEVARHWLIRSSITDIRNAKKVYMSLQRLAMLLYEEGDVKRAYRYITCSLEDISFGKARYRVSSIADYLSIIRAAYDERSAAWRTKVVTMVALLTFLSVALVVAFCVMRSRNAVLLATKRSLAEQNERLHELTERLTRMNGEVLESNRIKEEYIGMLFNTCSEYISRSESDRKRLLKAARTGSIADVCTLLQQSGGDGFKEFITQFDTIFLSIFPDFIASFNRLLRPGEQIHPKEGDLLTPELRIYALIRLGITDNAKIAAFLHYSLQTVYNYCLRMRSRTLCDGKDLIEQVRKL